jgi:hypothetical protein
MSSYIKNQEISNNFRGRFLILKLINKNYEIDVSTVIKINLNNCLYMHIFSKASLIYFTVVVILSCGEHNIRNFKIKKRPLKMHKIAQILIINWLAKS